MINKILGKEWKKNKEIIYKHKPFFRFWWTKNHATKAALTNRKPKAANEMPIITRFGVFEVSVNSAGSNSRPSTRIYVLKVNYTITHKITIG